MKEAALPKFAELETALSKTALKLHPSQVHGLVCGILCGPRVADDAWEELVTGGKETKKAHELLQILYTASAKELADFLLEFQLLLPPDSDTLAERAEALTLWCQGFLTGLKFVDIPIVDRAPSDTTETINDLIEIAKMNYDEVIESEEDEEAYTELVEYVRMGIIPSPSRNGGKRRQKSSHETPLNDTEFKGIAMINLTEYAKRRKALMQKIGATGIVILPSAPELIRNGDAHYPHRQHSDFYYLTGFEEPEAVLVLAPKRKEGEYILFNRVRDRSMEIWNGPRAGQAGAKKTFMADQSFPISELPEKLPALLADRESIHYPIGYDKKFDMLLTKAVNHLRKKVRSGLSAPSLFVDILPEIHEARLIKSSAEISTMQKAVDITAAAHLHAMRICKPGMYEYELEAALQYEFLRHGARAPAYTSIVGAGKNSCILHYIANNQRMKSGDLVLIDAGAEYQNYASDITRTFPINGIFSPEQRAIYDIVLKAQLAAIKTVKPGAAWNTAQDAVVKVITEGLVDLGILKGNIKTLIETEAYFPFYMHRSGHWLGLDVHDAGSYKQKNKWRPLQPGMVLTVEPGIYISAEMTHIDKRWHNIGIRIEDDVLVTKTGNDVLSKHIPKEIADIEAVMAS